MRRPFRKPEPSAPPLLYFIDVYWCDPSGTYLQGWATVVDRPLVELIVRGGSTEVVATRSERLDILPHYPAAVDAAHAGFRAYLPGRPGPVTLSGHDASGVEFTTVIDLPDHPLPVLPALDESPLELLTFPAGCPDGPILAIGVRSPNEESYRVQVARLKGREVVGFDIHPGIGVDVVGDAHQLSELFPPNHFAGIFTTSVIEHLSTPWVFAAECAKVLALGGRMLHQLPWTWPTHSQPADFWRASPEALQVLFGATLGFRTIGSGTIGAARVTPTPETRQQFMLMPTTLSALSAWIEVEKVDDSVRTVRWPYDPGAQTAAQYPVDGLADI